MVGQPRPLWCGGRRPERQPRQVHEHATSPEPLRTLRQERGRETPNGGVSVQEGCLGGLGARLTSEYRDGHGQVEPQGLKAGVVEVERRDRAPMHVDVLWSVVPMASRSVADPSHGGPHARQQLGVVGQQGLSVTPPPVVPPARTGTRPVGGRVVHLRQMAAPPLGEGPVHGGGRRPWRPRPARGQTSPPGHPPPPVLGRPGSGHRDAAVFQMAHEVLLAANVLFRPSRRPPHHHVAHSPQRVEEAPLQGLTSRSPARGQVVHRWNLRRTGWSGV